MIGIPFDTGFYEGYKKVNDFAPIRRLPLHSLMTHFPAEHATSSTFGNAVQSMPVDAPETQPPQPSRLVIGSMHCNERDHQVRTVWQVWGRTAHLVTLREDWACDLGRRTEASFHASLMHYVPLSRASWDGACARDARERLEVAIVYNHTCLSVSELSDLSMSFRHLLE